MRKEEVRGLIIYSILIVVALLIVFTVIKPTLEEYYLSSYKVGPLLFIILVLLIAYPVNAIGLEALHALGAVIGGYKVTSFNVSYFCHIFKYPRVNF